MISGLGGGRTNEKLILAGPGLSEVSRPGVAPVYQDKKSDKDEAPAVAVMPEIELPVKVMEEMGKPVSRLKHCQGQEVELD